MRCKGIVSCTHRLPSKIYTHILTKIRLLDNKFETIVLISLEEWRKMIIFACDFTKCKESMKEERSNHLTMIDPPAQFEGGCMPGLSIKGFGCFKNSFDNKSNATEDSYLLVFCQFGKGFYLHNGKNGVIEEGQFMIVKKSDDFSFSVYLPAEQMLIYVFSLSDHVPYAIATKNPESILTDIHSHVYGGWNIFMRAYNILSKENATENLPYASALLMSFIEAERFVRNDKVIISSSKSELVEKAIQYMYDNMQKDITIADLLELLECSRSTLFRHFREYKTTKPLEFLNEIRIKRACKLLKDTSLHINEICKEVGINNHVYFSRLFTKTIGMSPTEYRKVNRTK